MIERCGNVSQVYHTNIFLHNGAGDKEVTAWKENLLSILKDLPCGDAPIGPVVQLLVSALRPSKIYRIHHQHVGESSSFICLMLLMPPSCQKSFSEMEPVLQLPWTGEVQIECSLHAETNVRHALEHGHLFYSRFIAATNLVYDSGELPPLPEAGAEAKVAYSERLKKELGEAAKRVIHFYGAAVMLQPEKPPVMAFMLHQATELTFRGVILGVLGSDKKTHEIRVLAKHAKRIAPQLSEIFLGGSEEDKRLLQLLDTAYLDARYNAAFQIEVDDMNKLQLKVNRLIRSAAALFDLELGEEL